jgi:hypothetical protein
VSSWYESGDDLFALEEQNYAETQRQLQAQLQLRQEQEEFNRAQSGKGKKAVKRKDDSKAEGLTP